ncbi:MAG: hypothetical protein ABIP33_06395 [Pseudolysinimonas sp.]
MMIRVSIVGPSGVLTYVELRGYSLSDFYSMGLRLEVLEMS